MSADSRISPATKEAHQCQRHVRMKEKHDALVDRAGLAPQGILGDLGRGDAEREQPQDRYTPSIQRLHPGRLSKAVSFSASAPVLTSLTIAGVSALVIAKRRFEATLLASSVILSALVVYAVKTIVDRERPALWY
jgi:hypothetical protein